MIELDGSCCPDMACSERILHALSLSGGVIVGPVHMDRRCETAAVEDGSVGLAESIEPLLLSRGLWFGARWIDRIEGVPGSSRHFCERIGGLPP